MIWRTFWNVKTSAMPKPEIPTTWGMVVEGDEIHSAKTGKWYEVRGSVSIKGSTKVKIFAVGVPKAFEREASEAVTVRRGPTGKAVDVFQIIFSGQTMPETRE